MQKTNKWPPGKLRQSPISPGVRVEAHFDVAIGAKILLNEIVAKVSTTTPTVNPTDWRETGDCFQRRESTAANALPRDRPTTSRAASVQQRFSGSACA